MNKTYNNEKEGQIDFFKSYKQYISSIKDKDLDDVLKTLKYIDNKTFVYLDPPYKPISKTASFTSYSGSNFDDNEQIRLGDFIKKITKIGAKILLSNSDPTNIDINDKFFDNIYKTSKGFFINKIQVARLINRIAEKRGKINELLISNYCI